MQHVDRPCHWLVVASENVLLCLYIQLLLNTLYRSASTFKVTRFILNRLDARKSSWLRGSPYTSPGATMLNVLDVETRGRPRVEPAAVSAALVAVHAARTLTPWVN